MILYFFFFFSSRGRHTRWPRDWSSDVCSSDLAFDDLVRAGKVRYTGLSNFTGQELAAAAEAAARAGTTGPVNLQSGYSLLERDAADDAFDVCRRYGIGFTTYSPLAGGWLSGRYRAGQPYPAGSRMTLRPEPYQHLENQ